MDTDAQLVERRSSVHVATSIGRSAAASGLLVAALVITAVMVSSPSKSLSTPASLGISDFFSESREHDFAAAQRSESAQPPSRPQVHEHVPVALEPAASVVSIPSSLERLGLTGPDDEWFMKVGKVRIRSVVVVAAKHLVHRMQGMQSDFRILKCIIWRSCLLPVCC